MTTARLRVCARGHMGTEPLHVALEHMEIGRAVLIGEVQVVRSRRGRQHLVHVSRAGSTTGEVSVFGGGDSPATAEAIALDREPL
jgi:CRP-like cAMP-binding protein